ncbi:MAG: septation protein A [Desulfobulbus sp.]|nr:septation protein A [Desulfobulbus sp.]
MKLLFDFLPVLLFFLAYKLFDIYIATGTAIVATVVQCGWLWITTRKVGTMQLATLAIILVFGGLTLFLHDEQFIKWKPTVINWLFGGAFLFSQMVGRQTAIERLLGGNLTLPPLIWRRLNLAWSAFFLVLGGVNLYVMTYYDRDTWVNFKLFGMLGLTMVFIVAQSFYLSRHVQEPKEEVK